MNDEIQSRLFSPSAFEALRVIRIFKSQHPDLPGRDLIALIRSINPDAHDYEAGKILDEVVAIEDLSYNTTDFYRACIEVLTVQRPIWRKLVILGRRKFTQKLTRDEQKCFEFAGLLDDPPTQHVIEWWDKIAGASRLMADSEKMKRARTAEQLSLAHEVRRLERLGINRAPIWTSIDDNTVGYDLISFDLGFPDPINRLIEVKSTIASPVRFFISRNEWETAVKFGSRYYFHVWDLRIPKLYERTFEDVKPKIPSDTARGKWTTAEILIT